eukprot:15479636-Alexandrium_andersonii.AAC.1
MRSCCATAHLHSHHATIGSGRVRCLASTRFEVPEQELKSSAQQTCSAMLECPSSSDAIFTAEAA